MLVNWRLKWYTEVKEKHMANTSLTAALRRQRQALTDAANDLRVLAAKADQVSRSEDYSEDFKRKALSRLAAEAEQSLSEYTSDIRSSQTELQKQLQSRLPPEASFEERTYQHQRALAAVRDKTLEEIIDLCNSTDDLALRRELVRIVELTPDAKEPLWRESLDRMAPAGIRAAKKWERSSADMLTAVETLAFKTNGQPVTSKTLTEAAELLDSLTPAWDRISAEAEAEASAEP